MTDAYFLDLENWCLRHYNTSVLQLGKDRVHDIGWMEMIAEHLDHHTSKEYRQWVLDGGGEEWFQL